MYVQAEQISTVDIALPLASNCGAMLEAIDEQTGGSVSVPRPAGLDIAVTKMGLESTLGYIRMVQKSSSLATREWKVCLSTSAECAVSLWIIVRIHYVRCQQSSYLGQLWLGWLLALDATVA